MGTKVVATTWEATSRLQELVGRTIEEMAGVARAAVAARRDAVEEDPAMAGGMLSYIYGTRALRQLLRPHGWVLERRDGIESVYCPKRGIRIAFQNADRATAEADPRAVADKGASTARAVHNGNPYLFPEMESEARALATAPLWYLFCAVEDGEARAELSHPIGVENGQFVGFSERIFIIDRAEPIVAEVETSPFDPVSDMDVTVSRR